MRGIILYNIFSGVLGCLLGNVLAGVNLCMDYVFNECNVAIGRTISLLSQFSGIIFLNKPLNSFTLFNLKSRKEWR